MRCAILIALLGVSGWCGVIDRVAVVVGKTVFTESEVLENLRITEFINGDLLDLSPAKRREEADHLVDQQLLRSEMEVTHFASPEPAEADRLLQQFIKKRFPNVEEFRVALQRYGITEDQLKQQLLWQLQVVRFIDFRFRSELPPVSNAGADRASADSTATAGTAVPAPESVDQQLEGWLKEARGNTKIVLKPEAFQ